MDHPPASRLWVGPLAHSTPSECIASLLESARAPLSRPPTSDRAASRHLAEGHPQVLIIAPRLLRPKTPRLGHPQPDHRGPHGRLRRERLGTPHLAHRTTTPELLTHSVRDLPPRKHRRHPVPGNLSALNRPAIRPDRPESTPSRQETMGNYHLYSVTDTE